MMSKSYQCLFYFYKLRLTMRAATTRSTSTATHNNISTIIFNKCSMYNQRPRINLHSCNHPYRQDGQEVLSLTDTIITIEEVQQYNMWMIYDIMWKQPCCYEVDCWCRVSVHPIVISYVVWDWGEVDFEFDSVRWCECCVADDFEKRPPHSKIIGTCDKITLGSIMVFPLFSFSSWSQSAFCTIKMWRWRFL